MTVKLFAPEGLAALREGVRLIRYEEPMWKRKAFHGLCMVMIEMGKNGIVRASGDGLDGDEITLNE